MIEQRFAVGLNNVAARVAMRPDSTRAHRFVALSGATFNARVAARSGALAEVG